MATLNLWLLIITAARDRSIEFATVITRAIRTRILHVGRTAGRKRCRNGANPSNGKPHSARMSLNNMATEVPAQHWFAGSGLDLECIIPAKDGTQTPVAASFSECSLIGASAVSFWWCSVLLAV
jgi:hypothetical protein